MCTKPAIATFIRNSLYFRALEDLIYVAGRCVLEVFSALTGRSEGDNPSWYQHSRYLVYNRLGKRLESVGNTVGYYAEMPRLISLPPGDYLVKAQAKGHWWVEVPVKIERGRTTRVHLDAAWQMPPGTSKSELVSIPAGYPIGWRAGLTD